MPTATLPILSHRLETRAFLVSHTQPTVGVAWVFFGGGLLCLGFWSFLVIFGFPTSSSTKRPRVCSHFIHSSIVLISDGPGSDPNRRVFVVVENSVTGTHLPRPLSLSPRGRGGAFRTPTPAPSRSFQARGRGGEGGVQGDRPPLGVWAPLHPSLPSPLLLSAHPPP